jgi:hypothetical protein
MMTEILMLLTAVVLLGVSIASVSLRRLKRTHRDTADGLEDAYQRLKQMEHELGALCNAAVDAGEHLVQLQQKVRRIVAPHKLLVSRSGSERPYTQASQLLHSREVVEKRVDTDGLPRGKAELLVMMQPDSPSYQ